MLQWPLLRLSSCAIAVSAWKSMTITMTMTQRWFSLIVLAIALSGCNPSTSENANETAAPESPSETALEADVPETAQPGIPISQNPGAAPADVQTSPPTSPINLTQSELAAAPSIRDSSNPQETRSTPPTKETPTGGSDQTANAPPSPIKIDATVCGAGGQEAYFETKRQEIYICKNEAAALTYIATPKRKGNSIFLPAQKIQQGTITGYAATEDDKIYIVTSTGLRVQEEGQAVRSEKVIRRQLSKAE